MIFKTIIKQAKCIKELEKNIKLTHKNYRDIQEKILEDFVMTINEIQDVEAIEISEVEKIKKRNSIINNKRTKLITKLIELSNTDESFR